MSYKKERMSRAVSPTLFNAAFIFLMMVLNASILVDLYYMVLFTLKCVAGRNLPLRVIIRIDD